MPQWGELIVDPRRVRRLRLPLYETVALQGMQGLGQHLLAHAVAPAAQLVEAERAFVQCSDREAAPTAGDVLQRAVHLITVDEIGEAQWELLDGSDAIVFGSPTYMGTASGAFHQFAEDSSKRWFTDAWKNKPAAGFSNSASKSGDKLHTLQYFATLAAQHGMHWVNLGLKPGWNSTEDSEHDLIASLVRLGRAGVAYADLHVERLADVRAGLHGSSPTKHLPSVALRVQTTEPAQRLSTNPTG